MNHAFLTFLVFFSGISQFLCSNDIASFTARINISSSSIPCPNNPGSISRDKRQIGAAAVGLGLFGLGAVVGHFVWKSTPGISSHSLDVKIEKYDERLHTQLKEQQMAITTNEKNLDNEIILLRQGLRKILHHDLERFVTLSNDQIVTEELKYMIFSGIGSPSKIQKKPFVDNMYISYSEVSCKKKKVTNVKLVLVGPIANSEPTMEIQDGKDVICQRHVKGLLTWMGKICTPTYGLNLILTTEGYVCFADDKGSVMKDDRKYPIQRGCYIISSSEYFYDGKSVVDYLGEQSFAVDDSEASNHSSVIDLPSIPIIWKVTSNDSTLDPSKIVSLIFVLIGILLFVTLFIILRKMRNQIKVLWIESSFVQAAHDTEKRLRHDQKYKKKRERNFSEKYIPLIGMVNGVPIKEEKKQQCGTTNGEGEIDEEEKIQLSQVVTENPYKTAREQLASVTPPKKFFGGY
jgi:hypothetical protein